MDRHHRPSVRRSFEPRRSAAALLGCVGLLAAGCTDAASGPRLDRGGPAGTGGTVIVPTDAGYRIADGSREYASFSIPRLSGRVPTVATERLFGGWQRIRMTWQLDRAVAQDDLAIEFALDLAPDFQWIPHLTPIDGAVAAQHVFRAPALIVAEDVHTLVVVPDLEICGGRPGNPWYLDYDAPRRRAAIGMSNTTIPVDVLYLKQPGMTFEPGPVELGFFVKAYRDTGIPRNP